MRPYLTIIRDGFHEALASRVLWVLLVLETLFLLALAPLGMIEQAGWKLGLGDFRDPEKLLARLHEGGQADDDPAARHVFERLSADLKRELGQGFSGDQAARRLVRAVERLRDELNALLTSDDFYQAAAWKGATLSAEARELLEQGLPSLGVDERARFHRLALQALFPGQFVPAQPRQVELRYFTANPLPESLTLPFEKADVHPVLNGIVSRFMVYVLGVGGVFVAILVTASLIPNAFEGGAVDLLLSKPVSRSLVFLTRFLGGCAFILLLGGFLLVGLWLILGLRFGLWNEGLLWCIPLYMLVFAVYYGVSALAGVYWRNAIVAVVMTIVFWGVCFGAWLAKTSLENLAIEPSRLTWLVPAGDDLLALREDGGMRAWDAATGTWADVFAQRGAAGPFPISFPLINPVYDPQSGRLVAAHRQMPQFGLMSSPLLMGVRGDGWQRQLAGAVPPGTEAVTVDGAGAILAVAPDGLSRLAIDPAEGPAAAGFEAVGPDLDLLSPLSVSVRPEAAALALYDGKKLVVLDADPKEGYRIRARTERPKREPGVVALAGDAVMLALESGTVEWLSAKDLATLKSLPGDDDAAPRSAAVSPDGRRVAVVRHDRRLLFYDADSQTELAAPVAGQGDVSAVAFLADERLLVADRTTRVTDYQLSTWERVGQREPSMSLAERAYRYAIVPIHLVFPKPGELDNTVRYL
jgi:hypothetical protein